MILVTGGTGFLGGYLLRDLVSRGEQVRAIYREQSDFSLIADIRDQIDWVECDLLDLPRLDEIFRDVHMVYHTAAVVSFQKKIVPWMMEVNVKGTKQIVDLCLDHDVKKLVYASSIASLGRRQKKEEISEAAVWERSKHNSDYAVSKFRAEKEVWRGVAEGLDAAMVNPSLIMGAGRWDDGTPQMFKSIYHGIPAVPKGVTGVVDVRDVVDAMIMLMKSEITAERYILNAESISYEKLFALIAESVGAKAPKFKISRWQGKLVAYLDLLRAKITGGKPRIEIEYAKNFGKEYYYKNDKVKDDLDFKFTPIEETIKETGKVFLEKYPEGKPGMLSFG